MLNFLKFEFYLNCAGYHTGSCVDGPGIRDVLFLQGCAKRCNGCHNVDFSQHDLGRRIGIYVLYRFIKQKCKNKNITISGGEPLEQSDVLAILLDMLKNVGYNICLYTSYELCDVPSKILQSIDYLKTGPFITALRDDNLQFYGSTNQCLYVVNDGVATQYEIK